MNTLANHLKTAARFLVGHSPRSNREAFGFASTPPQLPGTPAPLIATDVPIGLDYNREPVDLPPGHVLISGDHKTDVTTAFRTFAIHAAKYPASRVHVYDSTGEWAAMRLVADRFVTRAYGIADGLSDDTAATQVLTDLEALHAEMQRRNDHLQALNADLSAAGTGVQIKSVADAFALPLKVLRKAGIDPARTDSESAGLHRHVVVIPDLDWWLTHDPHGTGAGIVEKLFWLAGRGEALGIHLVLALTSHGLPAVPGALLERIGARIVLRISPPALGNRMLSQEARDAGASTSEIAHQMIPMLAWLITADVAGHRYRKVQLYRSQPFRLHRALGWCHYDRAKRGWLTGDALTLHHDITSARTQHNNVADRADGGADQ